MCTGYVTREFASHEVGLPDEQMFLVFFAESPFRDADCYENQLVEMFVVGCLLFDNV